MHIEPYHHFDLFRHILNLMSDSTDDYHLFYDFKSGMIYFSDNIRDSYDLFPESEPSCTLAQWRNLVHPQDIPFLESTLEKLISGELHSYNLNYRIQNRKQQTLQVNSRGKCYRDANGQPLYIMGRLSSSSVSEKTDRLGISYDIDSLKTEIRQYLNQLQSGYLLLVGIDNLKNINLQCGRSVGNTLIRHLYNTIQNETNRYRNVTRFNGDCFAVSLPGLTASEIKALFTRIQNAMSGECTVSCGCVSFTDYPVPDADTLLQYAEVSLDYAKSHGKNMLSFFSPDDYENKISKLELREALENSVANDFKGFSLCYQAQIRSETYTVYGAETLLRFSTPQFGTVSPQDFIPLLEQTELIYPVGMWVLEKALEQCRVWREHIPDFHISVNMSYSQFSHTSIRMDVLNILRDSGVPGSALTLELTESMELLDYPYINEIFREWKRYGVEISVDDFGTGYSSLGRLKEMAVDEIKIDRCFVKNIQESAYNQRLLRNMLELADSCNIRVCCEGVESVDELVVLEEMHPALFQGFLFSYPLIVSAFEKTFLKIFSNGIKDAIAKQFQILKLRSQKPAPWLKVFAEETVAKLILEEENDIFYLSDMDTYELYYLNEAGKKVFGVTDYRGKKCHKVLHGADTPCSFCTNPLLRQDSFYVWENQNEYCGRHFLLKDKIVPLEGKNVRLEVAIDITKQEPISRMTQERLDFANRIVDYVDLLSSTPDFQSLAMQLLASVGDFYQADRAYLFEPNPRFSENWDNTYEWCAKNVTAQKSSLQNVPSSALTRWMEIFARNQSVIIYNLAVLQKSSPEEWKILDSQGIRRLIAVPVKDGDQVIAFIGVDNPRYAIQDDSHVRVLASFLLTRIRQAQGERNIKALPENN